jgi:dTDP-4-dehydro-6-deoxy-alpha-D-glucopyranose 2,3-dehydratase
MAFLTSALAVDDALLSEDDIFHWLNERKRTAAIRIDPIEFSKLRGWRFTEDTGNLVHDTGKFFTIEGITVKTNWGQVPEWSQPIINQPEIGLLGILAKRINGVLHFLMQAKIEPGNIDGVQISPTLQATKSNYTRVHRGTCPRYLDYFTGERRDIRVLLDQLQSEQGARFLRKRNRNIIVEVLDDVDAHDDFRWLTLGQIKRLLQHDNVVNMDTRTVLSGIHFGDYAAGELDHTLTTVDPERRPYAAGLLRSALDSDASLYSIEEIISWITGLKSWYELDVQRIPLNRVRRWTRGDWAISHEDGKYFSVIAVDVEIAGREVQAWSQPIVKAAQEGIIAFLIKKINGVYHFLVQAKLEAGNLDIMELAPTIQCLTGNYREGFKAYDPPYLSDAINAPPGWIRYSTMQSEEGGRFFREQNRNMIIEVPEEFLLDVPNNYTWMTLNQLMAFIRFNNYLNIEARSLISALPFV